MKKQEIGTIEYFEEYARQRFIDVGAKPERDWFTIYYKSNYKKKEIAITPLVDAGALKARDDEITLACETTWEMAFATASISLLGALSEKPPAKAT